MDKQLSISIARKNGQYFLMLNKKEISEGFHSKLRGFEIILQKFFRKELSFQNFVNLFRTIDSSNIPVGVFLEYKDFEKTEVELSEQIEIIESTKSLFKDISYLIFQLEHAQSNEPTPRIIHDTTYGYIQLKRIPDVSSTFTSKIVNLKDLVETDFDGINCEINYISLNLGASAVFRSKTAGVALIKELYLSKKITQAEKNKLLYEVSVLDIPNILLDESKKKYN